MTIRVFQGERELAAQNKMLGQFDLVGIPPAPRGMPQIEVTFDIDANGIVNVSAKDKATGKEQQIRIQASGGLSARPTSSGWCEEAAEHAAEDKKRKAAIEARNHADSLVYSTEKSLKEHGDKVSAADRAAIEQALADLKGVLESEDAEAIKAKTEALAQAAMKLGEAMYKAQAGRPGGGAGGERAGGGRAARRRGRRRRRVRGGRRRPQEVGLIAALPSAGRRLRAGRAPDAFRPVLSRRADARGLRG